MKKFLFVAICLFIVSLTAFAQQGNRRSPEENAKRTTEWMTTALKLTSEQVVKVDSINLVYAKAQAKLMEEANGDFGSVRESMQKLNENRTADFSKVLTDEQLQEYQKQAQERRRQGGGRGRN